MLAKLIQHALDHPPRCISDLRVDVASSLLEEVPDPQAWAYFALQCTCGSAAVHVLGYSVLNASYPDAEVFVGPLALECSDCGRIAELMDPRQHGYDAEFGYSYSMTGEGPREEFRCSKCEGEVMETVAGFEYSFYDDEIRSDEEMAEHPQDFFTWFSLYGRCKSCGAFQEISQYECA